MKGGPLMLAVLILSAISSVSLSAQDDAGIAIGSTPPAVTIEDLDGKPVDLSRLVGGRPALIEFWATWCPICRALEPKMTTAYQRYGAKVRFIAVAVAVNESPASVRRHLTEHPRPYPFLWDTNGNAVRAFQAPTTSFVVILDEQGKVAYTGVGEDQDLEAALARAMAAR